MYSDNASHDSTEAVEVRSEGSEGIAYKFSTRSPNLPTRQQHRRLRPLIHRLRTHMLCHIGTDITRTTAIDQHPTLPRLFLHRHSPRHTYNAALAYSICRARPAQLILLALLDGFGEGFHELGDVVDGLGLGERGTDGLGVFGIEMAGHAGYVY